MRPENVDDIYALSPMQHLMLLHSLGAPGSPALLNQLCYEIVGPLDDKAFRFAWEATVGRHTALRTIFLWEGLKQPVQVVRSRVELPFELADLSALSSDERDRRIDSLRAADRSRPFDLRKAPLMRLTLLRLGSNRRLLLWTSHHLILDRWCLDLLFEDLLAVYSAAVRGDEAQLPPARPFRDYIAWLERQDAAATETYWRRALEGFEAPSHLASRRARATIERAVEERALASDRFIAAGAFAKSQKISIGAVLQAAAALVVAEETGRRDVAFGLTASGRPPDLAGVELIVGSFVNNVPLRTRLEPDLPLAEWLRTIHVSQAERSRHEHASLSQIQQWSELPAGEPLFDLLTLLTPTERDRRAAAGIEMRQVGGALDAAFPAVLAVVRDGDRVALRAAYDPARISRRTVRRALGRFDKGLERLAGASGGSVGQLLRQRGIWAIGRPKRRRPVRRQGPGVDQGGSPEAILAEIWSAVLDRRVGLDDDFFALGGTSLQAAQAFSQMEVRLGRAAPLSVLIQARTVRTMLAELGQPAKKPARSLVPIQPHGGLPPLFAVPGIGGNVVSLEGLSRALGSEQPFYGLQSRGLDGCEPPRRRIEQIAAEFVEEMLPVLREPYALLGVCWGAAAALEIAQRLSAQGRPPALLALMDPAYLGAVPPTVELSAGSRFALGRLALYWQEFRRLRGAERWRFLRAKAARAFAAVTGRQPAGARRDFYQFQVKQSNEEALRRYQPKVYRGPASLFFTDDRNFGPKSDPRREWLRLIDPPPAIESIPGLDSGDALTQRHVAALAASLEAQLRQASRRAEPLTADALAPKFTPPPEGDPAGSWPQQ